MSVDFGPIPMPNSPLQDYFEQRYKASSENTTPASPQSPHIERGIENQLAKALADLAKKQAEEARIATKNNTSCPGYCPEPGKSLDALPQRTESSAASTGYTASPSPGHLKRRSLMGTAVGSQPWSRLPSR